MLDYSTVIIGPGSFSYSASYGYEATPIGAICEYGEIRTLTLPPFLTSPGASCGVSFEPLTLG
jgi:hypothetical protein